MNVKLLRKVKKYILAEPRRLDMNCVGTIRDEVPCGTVGCIAGWSSVLSRRVLPSTAWKRVAVMDFDMGRIVLKLTDGQARRLFNEPWLVYGERSRPGATGWPVKYAKAYMEAGTHSKRASVTAARIEHFIKTKGRE